jgi:hypothetical protein
MSRPWPEAGRPTALRIPGATIVAILGLPHALITRRTSARSKRPMFRRPDS